MAKKKRLPKDDLIVEVNGVPLTGEYSTSFSIDGRQVSFTEYRKAVGAQSLWQRCVLARMVAEIWMDLRPALMEMIGHLDISRVLEGTPDEVFEIRQRKPFPEEYTAEELEGRSRLKALVPYFREISGRELECDWQTVANQEGLVFNRDEPINLWFIERLGAALRAKASLMEVSTNQKTSDATPAFWKLRLQDIREQFRQCEPFKMAMIREEKMVSDVAYKAAIADFVDEIASQHVRLSEAQYAPHKPGDSVDFEELARRHQCRSQLVSELSRRCPVFLKSDQKFGCASFFGISVLMLPPDDASRVWKKLDELFRLAGGVLEIVPANVKCQLSPLAMSFDNRKLRWAACMFDIACRRFPGMTHAEIVDLGTEKPSTFWSATLDNVMACSVEVIDWLLAAGDAPAPLAGGKSPEDAGETPKAKRRGRKIKRDDPKFCVVIELHKKGNGPKDLVELTGLPLTTIKRYLSRHRMRKTRRSANK